MLELTFAEQVKLVLGRKNMTIKQLAEEIEEKTGTKMSRQNLTQRLGRDNFQEQDMKMIAEILGCPFHLSILGDVSEQQDSKASSKVEPVKEPVVHEVPEEMIKEVIKSDIKEEAKYQEEKKHTDSVYTKAEHGESKYDEDLTSQYSMNQRELTVGELASVTKDSERSVKGEINPYTGLEYKSNTVRVHPTRIGYVQVYNRLDHRWVEMTEWAFLGYQERQKIALGKAYEEPTYLD